ncbi:MAG: glycosyltransferase [Planctomycetota bacterium]
MTTPPSGADIGSTGAATAASNIGAPAREPASSGVASPSPAAPDRTVPAVKPDHPGDSGWLSVPADHDLTVLVPAFNEAKRIRGTLAGLKEYLDRWGIDYRVVVVDDGSSDGTKEVAAEFGSKFSTLVQPRNMGKGAAVRAGMLQATGRVVSFTDADLPYDLDALKQAYEWIRGRQCDTVFGARDIAGSEYRAHRKLSRKIASFVFMKLMRLLISKEVTDTQCGLKAFSRSAAFEIFARTTVNGFAFDAEVVFISRRLGLSFRRIPVILINEYASTLSLSRHALPMLLDVLRVRWRAGLGRHVLPPKRKRSEWNRMRRDSLTDS